MASLEKVVIDNPFDFSKRRVLPVDLEPGQALLRYLDGAGEEVITVINGRVVPPEGRALYIPRNNDQLIVLPNIQGGGGGAKGIIRSIALIGIAILATVYGGWIGVHIFGLAASSFATALGSAAILAAGSLLVSAILPLPKQEQTQTTQNYGWTGATLASRQGLPIPKPFGRFRQGGNVISSYIKTQGDKQYMNVLISYGFGPGASISDIQINDQPISNYSGIQYEVRLGTNDQKVVSFFSDSINDRAQQKRLKTGDPFFEVDGDRTDTQGLEVEFYFPKGIWAGPDGNGKFDEWAVYGTLQYRLHADSDWNDHLLPFVTNEVGSGPYWIAISQEIFASTPVIVVYASDTNAAAHKDGDVFDEIESVDVYDGDGVFVETVSRRHVGTWTRNPANPATGAAAMGSAPQQVAKWSNASFVVSSNSQNAKRYVYRIDHLIPGQYDVRVQKRGANHISNGQPAGSSSEDNSRRGEEMWLASIREIVYDDFIYPNMILLGIRALATDQLSGGGINVTAVVDTGESNPSKIAQSMMTDTLWGGSIPTSVLDQAAFDEWEDFCNETVPGDDDDLIKRSEWNGVFDTTGTLWDQLAVICAVSRANIVRTGLNYSVIVDKPSVPVQLFTVGNIIKDSFKESWLALADRANSIDLRFSDKDNDYAVTPLTVDAQVGVGVTDEIRKAPLLDLRGVTDSAHAFHEGELRLRQTQLMKRSVEFDAPVEAIACQVGNVIKVQHDVPRWGEGGKIFQAADVTHITLDKIVEIDAGKDYVITLIFPALVIAKTGGGLTASVSGSIVTLSATVATDYVHLRVTLPDGEYEVESFDGTHIVLAKPAGVTGTQTFQLVAIDAIETRTVTNVPVAGQTKTSAIVVSPGFSGLPFPNSAYAFGELLKEARDFRVISISKSSDLTYSIAGLEYRDDFYGEIDPILPPAPAGDSEDIQVSDLDAHEAYIPGASTPIVASSWRPGKYTFGADIYLTTADNFIPLPPTATAKSISGTIGHFDVYIRLRYTDGITYTGLSDPVMVTTDSGGAASIDVRDKANAPEWANAVDYWVASVIVGSAAPVLADYQLINSGDIGSLQTIFSLPSVASDPPPAQPTVNLWTLIKTVTRVHESVDFVDTSGFYLLKVVGYDAAGARADFNDAPVIPFTILGSGGLPDNVLSFRVTAYSDPSVTLSWSQVLDPDLTGYEIRYNFALDNSTWERAASVATPGPTDATATITKGAGTYLIKALNAGGHESGIASVAVAGRTSTRPLPDPDPDPLPKGDGRPERPFRPQK